MDTSSKLSEIKDFLSISDDKFDLNHTINTWSDDKKLLVLNKVLSFINNFSMFKDSRPFMNSVYICVKKTLEIEPEHPVVNFFLGRAYVQQTRYREAMNHFQVALKSYGDSTNMLATFAHAAAISGQTGLSEKILKQLLDLSEKMYVSTYDVASIYVGLKDYNNALDWLEKAFDEKAYLLIYLQSDPIMDDLRNEERYQSLCQKIFPEKFDTGRKTSPENVSN